jgi:hypothetical protein
MFLAHSFRLRDPWQCEPAADGGLHWSRVFHRPTGLEPDDQLVLVLTGAPPATQVTVNGQAFSPASSLKSQVSQYDLTAILADDNRIELFIPPQASSLKPQASPASAPFPYDARLAVIGHS